MLRKAYNHLPKSKALALLLTLVGIITVEIFLTVVIPMWREGFYNTLETKNYEGFKTSLVLFTIMMSGLGIVQGVKVWVGQLLSFLSREALTKVLFKPWVKGSRTSAHHTQAMTESLRNATEMYLEIAVEIVISLSIVIILIITSWSRPDILLAALAYTIVASALALFFNRPLIRSDIAWQKAECDFRDNLSILATGEDTHKQKDFWKKVAVTYKHYTFVVMNFTLFGRMKSSLSALVPYILLSIPFFAGGMTLGAFMSGVASFELIVMNSTILLMLYPKLMRARASYKIAKDFYVTVEQETSHA